MRAAQTATPSVSAPANPGNGAASAPGAASSSGSGTAPQAAVSMPPATASQPQAATSTTGTTATASAPPASAATGQSPPSSASGVVPAVPAGPAASPTSPPPPKSGQLSPARPEFDIVRVEPDGSSVVAGRTKPGEMVRLMNGDKVVAEVRADANGQFALVPPALGTGNFQLSLRVGEGPGATSSQQSVSVLVPERGKGSVVVALAEPDKPTRVLSDTPGQLPGQAAAGQAAAGQAARNGAGAVAASPLAIRTVEAEQAGGFYATGQATPGANIRLYVGEAEAATARAGSDGRWSLKVERPMPKGQYRIRADELGAGGAVAHRVEVPFDHPGDIASAARPVTPPATATATATATGAAPATSAAIANPANGSPGVAAPASAASAAALKARQMKSAAAQRLRAQTAARKQAAIRAKRQMRVARGDSLWTISQRMFGSGYRYTQIYEANANTIEDPDVIYPGQVLAVPRRSN